jgi:hypothetical protein
MRHIPCSSHLTRSCLLLLRAEAATVVEARLFTGETLDTPQLLDLEMALVERAFRVAQSPRRYCSALARAFRISSASRSAGEGSGPAAMRASFQLMATITARVVAQTG